MKQHLAVAAALVLVLTGCPKKADPVVDASPPDAAVVVLVDPTADAGIAPFTAEAGALGAVGTGAGTGAAPTAAPHTTTATGANAAADAGAVASADSGAAASADACCCEVPGQSLSLVSPSECTKGGKGACVKKGHCTLAGLKVIKTPADKTCCCEIDDKRDIIAMSACVQPSVGGKCVKMKDCKSVK